jgi:CheY-like chemotaxis protein
MKEDRINSLEAGMNEHITKPVYSTQLFSILNNLFQ